MKHKFNLVVSESAMFGTGQDYSFLNPYSLDLLIKTGKDYSDIKFGIDGGLLAKILSIMLGSSIRRISFDYTSIARDVFKKAQSSGLKVSLVGSEQSELDLFVERIRDEYPNVNICYTHSGYFDDQGFTGIAQEVLNSDILICSMGAVRQETFIGGIRKLGFKGTSYTCGGFFRQYATAENANYYPCWVDKLNLRAFYRMYKEPHTVKRYFYDYPAALIHIISLFYNKKLDIQFFKDGGGGVDSIS